METYATVRFILYVHSFLRCALQEDGLSVIFCPGLLYPPYLLAQQNVWANKRHIQQHNVFGLQNNLWQGCLAAQGIVPTSLWPTKTHPQRAVALGWQTLRFPDLFQAFFVDTPLIEILLATNCRCRWLLLHLITHNETYTDIPLDEWLALRRGHCLHNTNTRNKHPCPQQPSGCRPDMATAIGFIDISG